ncbi:MAG: ribosome-associated translation inhibitor RaiA [Kiritimatiellota bacterium]|nr:ribosome-associated translation inhibitor RaiA [Kiritimatiellota bacterium]
MTINITSRHADISETQKAHVHSKLAAVLEAYPEVEYAHVIMDTQKFRHIIEVVVQGKHHLRIEAKDESDDMYASVDKVADKVDRQLRRSRDKVVDHKNAKHRAKLADFEQELNHQV